MDSSLINIVLADDNLFLLNMIEKSLQQNDKINILAKFDNIQELVEYTPNRVFDVLVLDINFNGNSSLEYLNEIRPNENAFEIILLTTIDTPYTRAVALQNNISRLLNKNNIQTDLEFEVLDFMNSKEEEHDENESKKIIINGIVFTETKIKLLKALYENSEKNEDEIASLLCISKNSLKTHKRQLFEMSNTSKIVDLVKFGLKYGILLSK